MAIQYILIYIFGIIMTRKSWFSTLDVSVPGHDLWILDWACYPQTHWRHMFIFSTMILYRGIPGLQLIVLVGFRASCKLVHFLEIQWQWFCKCDIMANNIFIVFEYVLVPQIMIILFVCLIFSLNDCSILRNNLVLTFYVDVVLALFKNYRLFVGLFLAANGK